MLLCLSSGTDLQKSRHVLKSLSLCNKVLSYISLSQVFVVVAIHGLVYYNKKILVESRENTGSECSKHALRMWNHFTMTTQSSDDSRC